jgi:hypothetical protein
MGKKLAAIYDLVTQKAGNDGRIRLTTVTGMSKVKAAEEEDTDKLVKKFMAAASEIIGEDISDLI